MGLRPVANVSIEIDGKYYEEFSDGDGQYDAFVKAIRNKQKVHNNYGPRAVITWKDKKEFKTKGLDPDQNTAAMKATIRMLNIIENDIKPGLIDKILNSIS